jgi:hypothetical protein
LAQHEGAILVTSVRLGDRFAAIFDAIRDWLGVRFATVDLDCEFTFEHGEQQLVRFTVRKGVGKNDSS